MSLSVGQRVRLRGSETTLGIIVETWLDCAWVKWDFNKWPETIALRLLEESENNDAQVDRVSHSSRADVL